MCKGGNMSDFMETSYISVREDQVKVLMNNQPEEESLYDLADLFKVFGDSSRIRILYVLMESELCVRDIASLLNMNPSAVSHQLRILKDAKLVKNKRNGKIIVYTLDDDHVRTILSIGMNHVLEE